MVKLKAIIEIVLSAYLVFSSILFGGIFIQLGLTIVDEPDTSDMVARVISVAGLLFFFFWGFSWGILNSLCIKKVALNYIEKKINGRV